MHCLETIAIRNAHAAGRAASHAWDDQNNAKGDAIAREHEREYDRIEAKAGSDFALKVDAAFIDAYGKAQDAEPRERKGRLIGYAVTLGAWLDVKAAFAPYAQSTDARLRNLHDAVTRLPARGAVQVQFTAATCPGRPCSSECDHIGWV